MSFSYNNTRIQASGIYPIDFVRFKVDDIDATAYEIEDEEITTLYNETSSTLAQIERNYLTAIKVAEHLATRYKKQFTFSSAGTSMNLKERAEAWEDIVNKLRLEFMQISNASGVLYPNRPHYDASMTFDENGWIPYGRW